MKLATARFAEVEVPDETVLTFPASIIGFQNSRRYVVLDHDHEAPFKWLQSVDEGHLAFIIMDPLLFKPDYRAAIGPETVTLLESVDGDPLALFVILTIPPRDPAHVTANLRGPLVINQRTRRGAQIVLPDELPVRHPLFPESTSHPPGGPPVAPALTATILS
jgi:flagellar assembly factor FliW